MNKRLVLWSITVGLGGFPFGLDVAVISGTEQAIQKLWNLSDRVFPFFATNVPGVYIFGFFAFLMVLQLIYLWKMMHETKGVALENMDIFE